MDKNDAKIEVSGLHMTYGDYIVMNDVNFSVCPGEIKVIMGGSGCGKSTLLKHMIGLEIAKKGKISYSGVPFQPDANDAKDILKTFGVLFQGGALWSSMTLMENVALPLEHYTNLSKQEIREIVELKLALVGLAGFGGRYPSELSGGMQKRGGLARAMALDPEILFFDEPSAGLDPLSSRRLDDLILELSDGLEATVVIVTHELASIFAIADSALYLDVETKSAWSVDKPSKIVQDPNLHPSVKAFLLRGEHD